MTTKTGSTRIKGNALALQFGTPGEDYWADATSVVLDNEDKDGGVTTFEDASKAGGEKQWFFTVSAIQSTQPTSFWHYLWDNEGETVAFTYAPHGNEEASTDQPHFIGMCKVGTKPTVGGDADAEGEYTFEARLDVTSGPTLDDGSST